jgi:uncharacterized membrane protein (UPF0136 family)
MSLIKGGLTGLMFDFREILVFQTGKERGLKLNVVASVALSCNFFMLSYNKM